MELDRDETETAHPLTPTPKSKRPSTKSPWWGTLSLSPIDRACTSTSLSLSSPATPRITRSMMSPAQQATPRMTTRSMSPANMMNNNISPPNHHIHTRSMTMTSPTTGVITRSMISPAPVQLHRSPAPLPRSPSRRQRNLPIQSPTTTSTSSLSLPIPPSPSPSAFNTTSISASLSDLTTPTGTLSTFTFASPMSYMNAPMATTPLPFLFNSQSTSTTSTPETSTIIHTRRKKKAAAISTLLSLASSPAKEEDGNTNTNVDGGKGPHKKLFQKMDVKEESQLTRTSSGKDTIKLTMGAIGLTEDSGESRLHHPLRNITNFRLTTTSPMHISSSSSTTTLHLQSPAITPTHALTSSHDMLLISPTSLLNPSSTTSSPSQTINNENDDHMRTEESQPPMFNETTTETSTSHSFTSSFPSSTSTSDDAMRGCSDPTLPPDDNPPSLPAMLSAFTRNGTTTTSTPSSTSNSPTPFAFTSFLSPVSASESGGDPVSIPTESTSVTDTNVDNNTNTPPTTSKPKRKKRLELTTRITSEITMKSDTQPALNPDGTRVHKPCNCKKSKCLKLYCECFARGDTCAGCNCVGCNNTPEHQEQREKAVNQTLERDGNAFYRSQAESRVIIDTTTQSRKLRRGCHCKKSECLKKYCECYQAGVACSDACKCLDCRNGHPHHHHEGKRRGKKQAVPVSDDTTSTDTTTIIPTFTGGRNRNKSTVQAMAGMSLTPPDITPPETTTDGITEQTPITPTNMEAESPPSSPSSLTPPVSTPSTGGPSIAATVTGASHASSDTKPKTRVRKQITMDIVDVVKSISPSRRKHKRVKMDPIMEHTLVQPVVV